MTAHNLPRQWTLQSTVIAPGFATVTMLGGAGVIHVITFCAFKQVSPAGAAAQLVGANFTSSDGLINFPNFLIATLAAGPAEASDTWTGEIATGQGGSVTLAITVAPPAGGSTSIIMQGYDI